MLDGAMSLLRQSGPSAVTIDAVIARSGAPRGSVYYHFPGGRSQLLLEAGQQGADFIGDMIDASPGSPAELLDLFVEFWRTQLLDSNYDAGCPVASLALTPSASDTSSVAGQA